MRHPATAHGLIQRLMVGLSLVDDPVRDTNILGDLGGVMEIYDNLPEMLSHISEMRFKEETDGDVMTKKVSHMKVHDLMIEMTKRTDNQKLPYDTNGEICFADFQICHVDFKI